MHGEQGDKSKDALSLAFIGHDSNTLTGYCWLLALTRPLLRVRYKLHPMSSLEKAVVTGLANSSSPTSGSYNGQMNPIHSIRLYSFI